MKKNQKSALNKYFLIKNVNIYDYGGRKHITTNNR